MPVILEQLQEQEAQGFMAVKWGIKDYLRHSFFYNIKIMRTEQQQSQHQYAEQDAPFLVIYNHRNNRKHPTRPRLPRPVKNSLASHSIILTRKMAAKMEKQLSTSPPMTIALMLLKEEAEESTEVKNFFTAIDLERGIPMQDRNDEDILYNFNEMSLSQSHSKLDKILFGLCSEMEEEPEALLFP